MKLAKCRTLFLVTPILVAGCASQVGEEEKGSTTAEITGKVSAPSCNPSIADGAVPEMHGAMLDTIAFAEGTAGTCGQDGYNTGFAFHCFTTCASHPKTVWSAGGYRSSAAGRYQFLSATWSGLGLSSFSPKNQDVGAMKLVVRRGVVLPADRALTATEFSNTMKKLSKEWASLPFSPYGQPRKSLAQTRAKYCGLAGC